MTSNDDPTAVQRIAAAHAIAKSAEAKRLWAELSAVLDERDEAVREAGSPGRDWRRGLNANPNPNQFDGGVREVARIMSARIDGLDLDALREVGGSGTFDAPPPIDVNKANAAAAAATKRRSAREQAIA